MDNRSVAVNRNYIQGKRLSIGNAGRLPDFPYDVYGMQQLSLKKKKGDYHQAQKEAVKNPKVTGINCDEFVINA